MIRQLIMSRFGVQNTYYDYTDPTFIPPPAYTSQRNVVTTNACRNCNPGLVCTCPINHARSSYTTATVREAPVVSGYTDNYATARTVRSASVTPAPTFTQTRLVENLVQTQPVLVPISTQVTPIQTQIAAIPAPVMASNYVTTGYGANTGYVDTQVARPGGLLNQESYYKTSSFRERTDDTYLNSRLKQENTDLIREIHDLKKKEASSLFGRGRDAELNRLRQENVDLIAEVNNLRSKLSNVQTTTVVNLESNVTNLRQNITELETVNAALANENRQIRAEAERTRVDVERRTTANGQELNANINMLKTHLNNEVENANALNEELARVKGEYAKIRGQYDQLARGTIPVNEHEELITRHTARIRTLESDKQALERQVAGFQQEKANFRREVETHAEYRRRDAQEFDNEAQRLRRDLDIEIENRNELIKDLDDLKRQYEILKAENQSMSQLKSCKYHNEDGSLVAENQLVSRLNKQLQDKNNEIHELNQTILNLKREIQTLRLKHSEQLGSMESDLANRNMNDRQRLDVLQLEKEELALKNTYLQKEVERYKDQTMRSSSVERRVYTAPETTVTTYPVTTSTRVIRASEEVPRATIENIKTYETRPETVTTTYKTYTAEPVYNRVEYVAQPSTTVYTTTPTVYATPTLTTYKAEPVTTYTVPQVVTTSYASNPVVYQTTPTYSSSFLNATTNTTAAPVTTVYTNTTQIPETVTTKSEVRRSVIRI